MPNVPSFRRGVNLAEFIPNSKHSSAYETTVKRRTRGQRHIASETCGIQTCPWSQYYYSHEQKVSTRSLVGFVPGTQRTTNLFRAYPNWHPTSYANPIDKDH